MVLGCDWLCFLPLFRDAGGGFFLDQEHVWGPGRFLRFILIGVLRRMVDEERQLDGTPGICIYVVYLGIYLGQDAQRDISLLTP